jgi:hypothetical protein
MSETTANPIRTLIMNLQSFRCQRFFVPLSLVASLAAGFLLVPQSAQAQSADLLTAPQPGQTTDPFSNRGTSSNSTMMQLMQRLMQGPRRDAGEVSAEQKAGLDDATAAFRAKQQALLKAQSAGTPLSPGAAMVLTPGAAPVVAPAASPAPLLILTPAAKP